MVKASHNKLREVVLKGTQLKHCDLSYNNIYYLKYEAPPPDLHYLDVSHNAAYTGVGLNELAGLDTLICSKCSTARLYYLEEDGKGGFGFFRVDTTLVMQAVEKLPYSIKVI